MTAISRVERPSLLGVSAQVNANAGEQASTPATGTTQQRHAARVDQQYALAQYAAQQQYYQTQQAAFPRPGELPPIRDIAREAKSQEAIYAPEPPRRAPQPLRSTPPPQVQRAQQPTQQSQPTTSSDELVAQARDLVALHAGGQLTNAELMQLLVPMFRAT